jgi:hypothetical protein
MCLDLLDREPEDSPLHHVRYLVGLGHETMVYTKSLLQLFKHMGYGPIGAFHSFVSEGSQNYLFSGLNNHKAMESILYVFRPTMTDLSIERWLDTLTEDEEKDDVGKCLAYLLDPAADANFRNHVELAINMTTAYSCMIKGQRLSNEAFYSSGRKYLLGILSPLNHHVYAKVTLRDILQWYRCSAEVRGEYKRFFTNNGEGLDFGMEVNVKNTKQGLTSDTAKSKFCLKLLLIWDLY